MSTFNWEIFLRQWSQEVLESLGNRQGNFPSLSSESGLIQPNWLGYPGATDEQIVSAETRLGMTLPPSYREFLKTTNGWRQTTPFIYQLWSSREIEWFAVRHQNWINTFVERFLAPYQEQSLIQRSMNGTSHRTDYGANSRLGRSYISDQDYFIYGDTQDCTNLRVEYLQTALEISAKGDSAIYLLNPQVVTEDGEWEAWFFGDWLPGADRYRSFQEMMLAEYANFLEQREG
jgi:hypothetical protein